MLPSTDLIGYIAASLTTSAFIPQAVLTWKMRKAEGVSLKMYVSFTVGVVLWITYGIMMGSAPIIISNCVTLMLSLFILGMKLRFG